MAKSQKKSSLSARIKKENARKESRHAEVKRPGGGSLPGGINNGIAKLTAVDFNLIKKGEYKDEPRFYCHGVCVVPKVHEGIPCAGRLVQPGMIKLCDTKPGQKGGEAQTFAQNLKKAENRLKLLGFPTQDFDDLEEETLEYFKEAQEGDGMYFRFRTWETDGRVVLIIDGPAEDYEPSEDDDEIDESAAPDEDEDDEEEEEEEKKSSKAPKTDKKSSKKDEPEDEDDEEDEEDEEDSEDDEEEDSVDYAALAKKADAGDKKAQVALTKLGEKYDLDPEEQKKGKDVYKDWKAFAKAVEAAASSDDDEDEEEEEEEEKTPTKKPGSKKPSSKKEVEPEDEEEEDEEEEEEEEEEEAEPVVPSKAQIFHYTPKGAKKPKEVEITKVMKRTKTANAKSLSSDDTYEDIPWTQLSHIE